MTGLAWLISMTIATQPQTSPETISLSEAVRLSIAHSDSVRIASDLVTSLRAKTGVEASFIKPQLEATGNATRFDNKTILSLGGNSVEFLNNHQEALGLQLSQLLDVTGQNAAAVSQSRLNALSAELDLRAKTSDEALATTTDYFAALRALESVKVAQAALDSYREQQKTTTQLFNQGVGLKVDVLRSESQMADAERELLQAQNTLRSSVSTLDDRIGLPLDRTVSLVPTEDAAGATSFDRPALIASALTQRSEAMEASVDVAAAKKGIKLAHADAEPIVSLGLSGNYYPTTSFAEVRHSTAALAVNVQFSILDGGLARNRDTEARATVDSALAEQDRVKRAISLQVQNAALDVETAEKSLASARQSVEAAEAARKLADQRYAGQVAQYIEVTDAQAALTAAQGAQVNALYDLLTARARLTRAEGDWAIPVGPSRRSTQHGNQ